MPSSRVCSVSERKRRKAAMKELETPEEKRSRRLSKKDKKERLRKAALGWAEEHLGYTDQDNPYGDPQLSKKFVWHKREGCVGEGDDEVEARVELEKLKTRRIEREREREQRDSEREFMQRQKEAEYYKGWSQHEDSFHLRQVILRSQIRIQDGRAKPIDLLARYIFAFDRFHGGGGGTDADHDFRDDMVATIDHPASYLNDLSLRDLEDLLADIDVYRELDNAAGSHSDYWANVRLLASDLHARLADSESPTTTTTNVERDFAETPKGSSINRAVAADILRVLKAKTADALALMETGICQKISSNAPNLDIGYWESLLALVRVFAAKARLTDIHTAFAKLKLDRLRLEHTCCGGGKSAAKKGRYSPEYAQSVEIGVYVVDEHEDSEKLAIKRDQVLGTGFVGPDVEDAFEREAREGIAGNAVLSVQSHPPAQEESDGCVEEVPTEFRYLWSDKYRPRKPRFFNKVHTGYDWNQYNKKHYDTDNPPPKTVQGYKFNIFFPDLIDPAESPVYDMKVCEDCRDFAVLRFHSGPPYEDIAFKIVNKEWDLSHKHGFRCQFQNGIFQLWFHFRKWKYRR